MLPYILGSHLLNSSRPAKLARCFRCLSSWQLLIRRNLPVSKDGQRVPCLGPRLETGWNDITSSRDLNYEKINEIRRCRLGVWLVYNVGEVERQWDVCSLWYHNNGVDFVGKK